MNIERLEINNFAGLRNVDLRLSRMNVFIGPQASGKSVCAKLLFFFKKVLREFPSAVANGIGEQLIKMGTGLFQRYFPPEAWGDRAFKIAYTCGDLKFTVSRTGSNGSSVDLTFDEHVLQLIPGISELARSAEDDNDPDARLRRNKISRAAATLFDEALERHGARVLTNRTFFVPSGRSFFSAIRGAVFTLIAQGIVIDPFLIEFGSLYETSQLSFFRRTPTVEGDRDELEIKLNALIRGRFIREDNRYYIRTGDSRLVPVETSSSGQQEALPLALTLIALAESPTDFSNTLFVEEPEAHLYPTAQRQIVHLLAQAADFAAGDAANQYVVTTHSPYILASVNNLMYGGRIVSEAPSKRDAVSKALGTQYFISPANVAAYHFSDLGVESIIDPQTNLIKASNLDQVSDELAREFNALMDVDFEDEVR